MTSTSYEKTSLGHFVADTIHRYTIRECSQKIQNIVNVIHQNPYTTEETQKNLLHDLDSIEQRMKQAIRNCAERNKDNDLGKYILENYSEESEK